MKCCGFGHIADYSDCSQRNNRIYSCTKANEGNQPAFPSKQGSANSFIYMKSPISDICIHDFKFGIFKIAIRKHTTLTKLIRIWSYFALFRHSILPSHSTAFVSSITVLDRAFKFNCTIYAGKALSRTSSIFHFACNDFVFRTLQSYNCTIVVSKNVTKRWLRTTSPITNQHLI